MRFDRLRPWARLCCAIVLATLAACGGGGSGDGSSGGSSGGGSTGGGSPPAAPISKTDAFRFLNQSTYGATEAEVQRLVALGTSATGYGRWIDEQLQQPASVQLPTVQAAYANLANPAQMIGSLNTDRQEIWFRNSLTGPDQLRQRVAFALSEIMVVSQQSTLQNMPYALADYYDLLARDAFGDFRKLLEDVTLHPAMGVYLNMLGNQKPDATRNIRPDENYARETLQLFTIGLVELNPDGSVRKDAQGQPIPTYDQSVIEGFANVFTGWNYSGAASFAQARRTLANQVLPMQAYPEQHSPLAKQLLQYPGAAKPSLPAGQTAQQDLADALDNIFNHPNVGPFISKQLIQKLVTSNPSPQYVARVAAVFNNDGTGKRGNLGAVVKAILLDAEARPAAPAATARQGEGTAAAPDAAVARLRRQGGQRPVPHRQHQCRVRPGAAAVAVGVQFLQPVLRAARRDRRPGPGRTRAAARHRVPQHHGDQHLLQHDLLPQLDVGQRAAGRRGDRHHAGSRTGGRFRRAGRTALPTSCLAARSRRRSRPRRRRPSSAPQPPTPASAWRRRCTSSPPRPNTSCSVEEPAMNRITRRRFVQALGAGGLTYAFGRTADTVWAQTAGTGGFSDYKALVCVFLFGGNDSWNMVVPRSAAEYARLCALAAEPRHRAGPVAAGQRAERRAACCTACIPRWAAWRACSSRRAAP